jgi:hypothetical protein
MMVKTLERNARSLFAVNEDGSGGRRIQQDMFADDQSVCDYIEATMGAGFLEGDVEGSCTCTGDVSDTLELSCSMDQICEPGSADTEPICASMDFTIKMSGLMNENGDDLGDNPTLDMSICVDMDLDWFEELCFTMNYSGMDMLAPAGCGLTYGGEDCICLVDTVDFGDDNTFGMEVPCFTWDCTEVVPEPLVDYMYFSTCDAGLGDGSDGEITDSFAIFENGVPTEVAREMEAYQAENGNGGSSAATSAISFGAAAVILAVAMVA